MKFQTYYNQLSNLERRDFLCRAGTTRQMFWKWRRTVRMPKSATIENLARATEDNCTFFEVQQFFRDLQDAKYLAAKFGEKELRESLKNIDISRYSAPKMKPAGEIALELITKINARDDGQ